jgi:ubiquinone/menaquinone biosynthesis C-methylase UbiE
MVNINNKSIHPRWLKFILHLSKLYINKNYNSIPIIKASYDKLSTVYEDAWSSDYWELSDNFVDRLLIKKGDNALDLFCGTGYITERIAKITKKTVIGVDISQGMLKIAKEKRNTNCKYINSEVIKYIKKQDSNSFDIVTCGWGLGYSNPSFVINELKRILKRNGKLGIIENTYLSIPELQKAVFFTIAENPEFLDKYIQFRFPFSISGLKFKLFLNGFNIDQFWKGQITYYEKSEIELIKKIKNSSIIAGYKYMIKEEVINDFFNRFASILNQRYKQNHVIPIKHKYIGIIGNKK